VLFGHGDGLLSPWLEDLSAGRAPRIRGGKAWVQPLWIEDATRAVRKVVEGAYDGERLEILGPDRWRVSALAAHVCAREGSRPSRIPGSISTETEALLRDQQTAPDDWERLGLGTRKGVDEWLSSLRA